MRPLPHAIAAAAVALLPITGFAADVTASHALSLVGAPQYGPDFTHLDWVNPDAPKGGDIRLSAIGTFDSLHPFIARGTTGPGLGMVYQTLMAGHQGELSTEYGLIAETVEVPADLSWVAFNLRPEARWHDGRPITSEDVVWSFERLIADGRPFYKKYYANVVEAVAEGPHRVRFAFDGAPNRELPQIVGQLIVLPKHYWADRDFTKTTLEPPLGSGPYRIAAVDAGRSLTLERVEDWWAADLPLMRGRYNFDTIRYDYYRDQTVALEAFKSGAYDVRLENTAKNWATAYDFPATETGAVQRVEVPDLGPQPMQAFVMNTRRPLFADRNVRLALAHAFDFEWSNRNLFFSSYTRTESYFHGGELAATGLPEGRELDILEGLRGQIPDEVFTTEYAPPTSDGSGSDRRNLRAARQLLEDAGWTVDADRKLVGPNGEPFDFEILLVSPAFERIVAPFARNLERLGIAATVRTVDSSQYINRLRSFDFDMIVGSFAQSNSPGNEQRDFWGSAAANLEGSRNTIGIREPAIDALIDLVIRAPDRAELIAATRALDRVLLWHHFVIPQWHVASFRVAYWDRFGRPERFSGNGIGLMAWWVDPAKDVALERASEAN